MSLRDLPSLLRRRASSTVRDGWKVIRPRSRHSVSTTDLGPQAHRLRQTAVSKSASTLNRENEAESFLPGSITLSPRCRLERLGASALKAPDIPGPGEEMSGNLPTPSTGSSGVILSAAAPGTPPEMSMLRFSAGFDNVTYFSDLHRPGSRPRPRPCFLLLEEGMKA
mgnify:CR=1 FL=1